MFPFKQRNEFVFGSHVCQPDHILFLDDDLIVDYADIFDDPLVLINKSTTTIDFSNNSTPKQENYQKARDPKEKEMRKVMHRDIERKRREEMAKLHASLRSLLPLEHNKGKRLSTSDHMNEAVNYTKQLQKKVQELRIRRDKLKKLSMITSGTKSDTSPKCRDHNCNLPNSCVTLNMGKDGMEILISSSSIKSTSSGFRLSRVIKELHGNGFNVVSCVSTKINGSFLHKIQAEAIDMKLIDVSMLQERLTDVVN